MILRRNNLRSKSPKSIASLKKINSSTKKYCSERKKNKSLVNKHVFDKTKKSKKVNKDAQAPKTKSGKFQNFSNKIKLSAVHSSPSLNAHSCFSSEFQPSVNLRRLSKSFGLYKDALKPEKIGSTGLIRKKTSKNSLSCNKSSDFSSINGSGSPGLKKRLRKSMSFSEVSILKSEKKKDLLQKSVSVINPLDLSKRNKAKPSAKSQSCLEINNESKHILKRNHRIKKTTSKKAHSSTSCLDDLISTSTSIDNSVTAGFRNKLRSSSSFSKIDSVQNEKNDESCQSGRTKFSRLKSFYNNPGQLTKIKPASKYGQTCGSEKKESRMSTNKTDSRKESTQTKRRNKKGLHSQEGMRNTRGSVKSTLNGGKRDKTNTKVNSNKGGKKKKESTNRSTKNIEKNLVRKKNSKGKNRDSNKLLNATEPHVITKENQDQKRPTTLEVKKTVVAGYSPSKRDMTKSFSWHSSHGFNSHINSFPLDDLTASRISTSNTIERLFTSSFHKRTSISSTPLLKKKSLRLFGDPPAKKLLPGKGSLKRKRWVMSSLKGRNEGYEDDLFENSEFKEPLWLDESDDLSDVSIATPKCAYLVTPDVPSKTPYFRDCYSPSELLKARKVAEEYMHRRNKKRKNCSTAEDTASAEKKTLSRKSFFDGSSLELKRLEFPEFIKTLNATQNSKESNDDSEEEKDDYMNDVSF